MKKNKLYNVVVIGILYVAMLVYTYFGTTIVIEGQELPQSEAGMWGIIGLHVVILIAGLGALALHFIVETLTRIWDKISNRHK